LPEWWKREREFDPIGLQQGQPCRLTPLADWDDLEIDGKNQKIQASGIP
jgi:hypothetical protein